MLGEIFPSRTLTFYLIKLFIGRILGVLLSMVLVLESVGLPTAAIAILLPIDRILDTVRTAVNVEGDMVASVVVDKLTRESHSPA